MTLQGNFTPPFVDDGRLEVVGFTSAWHGLLLLAPNGHGTRLAQVKLWCPKDPRLIHLLCFRFSSLQG